jgi:hypothetical protein
LPNVIVVRGKKRGKRGESKTWKTSQNCPYGHILRKTNTSTFWCMVTPLDPHSIYTWWGAQHLWISHFLEIRPWKCDHGKWPSPK